MNQLGLNISKCKLVTYSRKKELDRAATIRDLGVIFDGKLTFNQHISDISSCAGRSLGFIVRNCKDFTSIEAIKTLYYAFVRAKLEYACQV